MEAKFVSEVLGRIICENEKQDGIFVKLPSVEDRKHSSYCNERPRFGYQAEHQLENRMFGCRSAEQFQELCLGVVARMM
eukprot:scaffold5741_cov148-Cylindrotheca_fusiformis.AAC.2